MKNKVFYLVIGFVLWSAGALFAELNEAATGNDWVRYNKYQKKELVAYFYSQVDVDSKGYSVDDGVEILDAYISNTKELARKDKIDEKLLLQVPCKTSLKAMIRVMGPAEKDGRQGAVGAAGPAEGPTDRDISVSLGEHFDIILEVDPTTGYRWEFSEPLDNKIFKFNGALTVPGGNNSGGGTYKQQWRFEAVAEGYAVISLKYVKQGSGDSPPAKTKVYTLEVKPR